MPYPRRRPPPISLLVPTAAAAAAFALLLLPAGCFALDDYAASFGKDNNASNQQQQQKASAAAAAAASASASSAYDAHTTRRERNLDHWDADTLAAYLGMDPDDGSPLPEAAASSSSSSSSSSVATDAYLGNDAAVLFYAQWCPNCHALAPTWDAIATMLEAGTVRSNLIMALFDCERDERHAKLCGAAGVKHYPTLLYAGSGEYRDTDPVTSAVLGKDKSAGPAGASTLRRTVKFQGDWRYGDQVLDWVKAMRALSGWHRLNSEGWLGRVRRGIFGLFRGGGGKSGKNGGAVGGSVAGSSLPVGVPPSFGGAGSNGGGVGGGGASSYALERKIKAVEEDLAKSEKSKSDLDKAVTHAGYIIESVLFPVAPEKGDNDTGKSAADGLYVDPFAVLASNDGWDATAIKSPEAGDAKSSPTSMDPYLLKTCVVDLSLDYCTRASARVTTVYLDELTNADPDAPYPSLFEVDGILKERVAEVEPFCALFDDCLSGGFVKEECRPKTCPFANDVACRFVAACFEDKIQEEYREALAELAAKTAAEKEAGTGSASTGDQKAAVPSGGKAWGLA